jgi:fatty acid desaturase
MRDLSPITDPGYTARKLAGLDQFLAQFIRDERDLPFVYLSMQIFCTIVPLGLLLYTKVLTGAWWYVVAVSDVLLVSLYFLGPYTLMLHLTSHRRFYKAEYSFMNKFVPWIIGPFMGQSPESYYSHHVGMHHPENNLPEDGSCTMDYQRDELLHYLHYFASFMTIGVPYLNKYLLRHNKVTISTHLMRGEYFSYAFLATLSFLNFRSTLFVFLLPYVIIRFGMMSGNWAQHAFIVQESPENNYTNSITCVNAIYNRLCFNDGYHIGHHLKPTMHWTELPDEFMRNQDKYIENGAIVFEQIDFFIIWFFLMCKRYDWLAYYYVNLGNKYKNDEEVIAMLKSRTRRFVPESEAGAKKAQ